MVSIESALQRLSGFIERQLPALNAPGIAIGLTHREQVLHVGVYGLANRETKQPVKPETLFQIGSITKSFTSIVLLQLQEQGLLDINDPVTNYLPWFEIQSEHEPITLRHLMSHTAGIIMGSDETVSAYTETWDLRHTKATASPGEMFHYSNSGYKVLGVVLQTILGQSMADILRKRVLDPLSMFATLPVIRTEDRSKMAGGYSPFFDDRPLPVGGLMAPATWLESDTADGSICSTAEDICRYLRALLNKGRGLISEASFEQLIHPVIPTGDELHGEQYGLGLSSRQINGHQVIGHSGGMVGYTADMLADLDAGLGVVVLTNGPAEPAKISRYALKLLRAACQGDELPPFPEDDLHKVDKVDNYAGTYSCGEKTFTLTSKDERLYLDFETASVLLELRTPDHFLVPHPAFELFLLQMGRENDQIVEAIHGGERYIHSRYQGETSFEIPPEWLAYPGHYRSHNPWFSNFRVVLRTGQLTLIQPGGDEEALHPLEPGFFRVGADPRSPEFICFDMLIDGKAMQANFSGGAYCRTFTP
ncbi:MAG: beta-lactamase family protein [Chloroflexi bacterium]|nr:beta-lactamase family protein [Chloroflexota bacterium]